MLDPDFSFQSPACPTKSCCFHLSRGNSKPFNITGPTLSSFLFLFGYSTSFEDKRRMLIRSQWWTSQFRIIRFKISPENICTIFWSWYIGNRKEKWQNKFGNQVSQQVSHSQTCMKLASISFLCVMTTLPFWLYWRRSIGDWQYTSGCICEVTSRED